MGWNELEQHVKPLVGGFDAEILMVVCCSRDCWLLLLVAAWMW